MFGVSLILLNMWLVVVFYMCVCVCNWLYFWGVCLSEYCSSVSCLAML